MYERQKIKSLLLQSFTSFFLPLFCLYDCVQSINLLLNEILNVGVVGGCNKLCSVVKQNASKTLCNIACDLVGIKTFVKLLNQTDLDPFNFCENLKICPMGNDDAAGKVMNISSHPNQGEAGTQFAINLTFNITNETGPGEIGISITGPGDTNIHQGFANTGFKLGSHTVTVSLDTTPDPSAFPPVDFPSGFYDIRFDVCQGECGSKHPHSILLDSKHGSFNITQ